MLRHVLRLIVVACAALSLAAPAGALAAPPANDHFANAQTLNSGVGVGGTNIDATFQAGEPPNSEFDVEKTVWYRWTASFSGQIAIDACTNNFFLNLAVYRGTALEQLTFVDSGNIACGGTHARTVPMDVTAGETYYVQVDGLTSASPSTGSFTIRLDFYPRPPNDAFADAQALGSTPINGTNLGASRESGEPANSEFSVDHTVWYRYTPADDGRLVVDACNNDFYLNLAVYRGPSLTQLDVVDSGNNACAGGVTHASTVPMDVQQGITYYVQVDGLTNGPFGTFAIFASLDSTVDNVAPVISITGGPLGPTNARRPTFTFSAHEPLASAVCEIDGVVSPRPCDPTWQVPSNLPDGNYTFRVRALDESDNAGEATRSFSVDGTAPATSLLSGPSGTTRDTTPTFTFAAGESGATFRCRVDSQPFVACGSPRTVGPLAPGAHTFAVAARDAVGNQDPTPATRTFTVAAPADGKPPADRAAAARSGLRRALARSAKRLRALGSRKLRARRKARVTRISAPSAGTLRVTGLHGRTAVVRGTSVYSASGRRMLVLRVTAKGRRLLRRKPRLRITLRGRFAGSDGRIVVTAKRKFTLK